MHSDPRTKVSLARSPRGGFTLIEMAVVFAIIAIMSALAVASINGLTKQAAFSGVAGELVTGLRRTQQEATARGQYTAFILDTTGGRWWGIQTDASFSLASFNPSSP